MINAAEFKLSITRALRDQLTESINTLIPIELSMDNLNQLENLKGVYQLYHREALVYIGKADKSLPTRLTKHYRKISGREGISSNDMKFTCLYIEEDLSAVAPETLLIQQHKSKGEVPWNFNGFGNNDPGRQRDTTTLDDGHFDKLFPIDLNWRCEVSSTVTTVSDALKLLKDTLPYLFRHHTARKNLPPIEEYSRPLPLPLPNNLTARELFEIVASVLPASWQITIFPSYVIMYPEQKRYPEALFVYLGQN